MLISIEERVYNVIKKSSIFNAIGDIIEEEDVKIASEDIKKILYNSNDTFDIKQDNISEYLLDFLEKREIEISLCDSEAFANVLVWIYEEYGKNEDGMYKKIMDIETHDSSYESISSEDSEDCEH